MVIFAVKKHIVFYSSVHLLSSFLSLTCYLLSHRNTRRQNHMSHSALAGEQLEVPIVRARYEQLRVSRQIHRHDLAPIRLQGCQKLPIICTPYLDQTIIACAGQVQPWAITPFLRERFLLLLGGHGRRGGALLPLVVVGLLLGFVGCDVIHVSKAAGGLVLALHDVRRDGPVGAEEAHV
jgi:hypothetical protein